LWKFGENIRTLKNITTDSVCDNTPKNESNMGKDYTYTK
jgi:hypothetical protein